MKLTEKKFNLFAISEARNVIFGIVTLWIGLFHSTKLVMTCYTENGFINGVFKTIKGTGNVGVDIFLLLSGIGLYFSFTKDDRVGVFLKKRFMRVLPTAFLIAVIFFSYIYVFGKQDNGFLHYLSRVTFTYFFWTGERVFWFVSIILVLYLLFPMMYRVIERFRWRGMLALIAAVMILTFVLRAAVPDYYALIEVALCRIPIFIFGIWMGKFVMEKREISFWWLPVSFVGAALTLAVLRRFSMICKLLNPEFNSSMEPMYMFIYRYTGSILAVCLVVLSSFVIVFIRRRGKLNFVRNFFEFVGLYSLEYYMIYLNICNHINAARKIPENHQIMLYFGGFVLSLVLCMAARKVCDQFMAYMARKPKKKEKN